MSYRDFVFVGAILVGAGGLTAGYLRSPLADRSRPAVSEQAPASVHPAGIEAVDRAFRESWKEREVEPTDSASDLAVMRRLGLALTGSIPSLEEIRRLEASPREGRVERWLEELLADRRASDHLAERMARAYVGTEGGPFLLFRRRRFTTWLSDAIHEDRPYDQIVREMIAGKGLWTDSPPTNFLTVTQSEETGRPDPERLAARVSRAFLGSRLDCAQCHDHPFQPWKQDDFRGLAAFFGGVHADLRGLRDSESDYRPIDRRTNKPVETAIAPAVPFGSEFLAKEGNGRERLADWVVNPKNPRFPRATANRFWALMFGQPMVAPVDDLPPEADLPPALIALAEDFAANGYRLHHLIRVIALSEAFRRESAGGDSEVGPTRAQTESWAAFPMTRLRPEQVARSVYQTARVETLGAESPWYSQLLRYTGRNDFVKRYGDTGEDEFEGKGGTIPQRLLLMNGELVRDKTNEGLFNASARIAEQAPSDEKAVEAAYLTVLTRRPSTEESTFFVARLREEEGSRKDRLTDLFWTLLNSTEFSWNH